MSIYNFIELGIAYLLAAMMPGPSIALIIRNALINSRLSSIQAALGTILGTALQFGLVLIILVFIENNLALFKTLKILCSIYLIYLGIRMLFTKQKEKLSLDEQKPKKSCLSNKHNYFLEALFVEFLNPLAFSFFISIITVFVDNLESFRVKFICWLEIVSLSSVWFVTVSLVISSEKITFYTRNFNRVLEISAGCIFILFGSKILLV
ncbi:MAG: LysE family translocator [Alphaproteobacteria bacterium]|nr:LysE family translocator [Alphaproteobacteria bacterium]